MNTIDRLMRQAVGQGVFAGGVLLASRGGSIAHFGAYGYANLFVRRPMTVDTVFDLASLTKPLATTLAVVLLQARRQLSLDQCLDSILTELVTDPKGGLTVRQLLCHSGGLPAHQPYYETVRHLPMAERRTALRRLLREEPLTGPPGVRTVYSDLGFMLLEWVIERVAGCRMDRLLQQELYTPLGLTSLSFRDLAAALPAGSFAATELCPWRGRLMEGEVHDDNAHAAGGVAGQAGLFGSAMDVHRLLEALLAGLGGAFPGDLVPAELLPPLFRRCPGGQRALGFDLPAVHGSSCGRFFSRAAVGHLGFTGTSFWMDPVPAVIVVLLTHRVHPWRHNDLIRAFRPRLHDAVMQHLGCVPD